MTGDQVTQLLDSASPNAVHRMLTGTSNKVACGIGKESAVNSSTSPMAASCWRCVMVDMAHSIRPLDQDLLNTIFQPLRSDSEVEPLRTERLVFADDVPSREEWLERRLNALVVAVGAHEINGKAWPMSWAVEARLILEELKEIQEK